MGKAILDDVISLNVTSVERCWSLGCYPHDLK
jgi:hypothetical protein